MNKEKEFDHQFKTRENSGEHRNGRKSQFKNHNSQGEGNPNEYISKTEENTGAREG
ncbi:hypothetical protein EV207_15226 [Scopulibacillus darangshiensis]|uniref:Uncharacterized protein n=1 Tax=Scopulibacillus darangshiensis TaxID=442528 RepID=A0A4R2NGK4_9BACL|nr:hypothetical protein [Scopulibacillus darangshiensis]TCP20352.1 hypothetical protein EV207_15226 [Scopulibacillus darangshiensis]